jgi:hypothetical protein
MITEVKTTTVDHQGNPFKMPNDPAAKSAVHALILKISKELKPRKEAIYVFDASVDKDGKIRHKEESGFLWAGNRNNTFMKVIEIDGVRYGTNFSKSDIGPIGSGSLVELDVVLRIDAPDSKTLVAWESFMIGLLQEGLLRRGQFLNQKITNHPTDPENLFTHCAGIVKIKIGDLLESGEGAFNKTCLKADEMKQLFNDEKFWVEPAQGKK